MRPLDRLGSIKTKLGVLIAATILVAASIGAMGTVLRLSPAITVPLAVLVGLGLTQVLARGMTSPLREMTAAARRMATGDYSQRVTATSRDEVGELARAFNTMAADLAEVDRGRRDLVANVSHELRTPVAALQAVLENLVDGVARPDPATLRAALAQTERLGALVSDLLDLSRVDSGSVPLAVSEVALQPFLAGVVAEAGLAGHPVSYDVCVHPTDLTVPADAARLHQLLANLLDNAARHSPSGGRVSVAVTRENGSVNVDVADLGPGIPPGERDRVFERFVRGTSTPGETDGGTGLGLAIARWVTDLHGGSIAVLDSGPSGGCRIRASLPSEPSSR
jgi:two-component system sensor histidine kinase BaeS